MKKRITAAFAALLAFTAFAHAKASWGLNRTFRKGMNASGNISGTGNVDKGHNFTMQSGISHKFAL